MTGASPSEARTHPSLGGLAATLAISVVLFGSVLAAAVVAYNAERRTAATRNVLEATDFALETMVRTIRQATPGTLAIVTPLGCRPGSCLELTHPTLGRVAYRYCERTAPPCPVGQAVFETVGGVVRRLTAPDVGIASLSFSLRGGTPDRPSPERVTIAATVAANPNIIPTVDVQTTVVLRTIRP